MKNINVIWAYVCSLFLFTGCYTNEFGEEESTVSKEITEEEAKVLIERIEAFDEDMDRYLEKVSSIDEMQQYIDDIANNPNVERAWIENDAVCVKIEDGGIIVYDFNVDNSMAEHSQMNLVKQMQKNSIKIRKKNQTPIRQSNTRAISNNSNRLLQGCENRKVLIFNAATESVDTNHIYIKTAQEAFSAVFGVFDVEVKSGSSCTIDFILNHFTDYGFILMLAHGVFVDNQHYICTGDKEIWGIGYAKAIIQEIRKWINKDYVAYKRITDDLYWAISEKYISESMSGTFAENSILYAVTCHSLQYNNNLAEAFHKHGLTAFIGFDNEVVFKYGLDGFYSILLNLLIYHSSVVGDDFKEMSLSEAYSEASRLYANFNDDKKNLARMCMSCSKPDDMALFSTINTQKVVNIGLPSNWGGYNIGASSPEEYGDLIQWGTSEYENIEGNICGTKYDGATIAWGKEWHLPNKTDWDFLLDQTKCRWEIGYEYKGVKGARVTGPSGESIFLPAAGCMRVGEVSMQGDAGFYPSGEASFIQFPLLDSYVDRLIIDMVHFHVADHKWGESQYKSGDCYHESIYNSQYIDNNETVTFSDYKYTIRAVQDNPYYKKNASLFSEKKDNVQIHSK